jgi:hypothetical protein
MWMTSRCPRQLPPMPKKKTMTTLLVWQLMHAEVSM